MTIKIISIFPCFKVNYNFAKINFFIKKVHANQLNNFYLIGINYKKTDAAKRGIFSINQDQYLKLFISAHNFNIHQFFVLSTCNRTEIYGVASNPICLIDLLCTQTSEIGRAHV